MNDTTPADQSQQERPRPVPDLELPPAQADQTDLTGDADIVPSSPASFQPGQGGDVMLTLEAALTSQTTEGLDAPGGPKSAASTSGEPAPAATPDPAAAPDPAGVNQPGAASTRAADAEAAAAERRGSDPAPAEPAGWPKREIRSFVALDVEDLHDVREQLASVTSALEVIENLRREVSEMTRLRARDVDITERLHAENTKLRQGELATANAPLMAALLRLHDQMASLAAGDTQSVAGMLRTQLVQILDTSAGVTTYEAGVGEDFNTARHTGTGRTQTTDRSKDNTVARTVRAGFARSDGSVVRVAAVEVYRHQDARADDATSASSASSVPTH